MEKSWNFVFEFLWEPWIVICHFSEICTRAMALDLRRNFVSAQYLEN